MWQSNVCGTPAFAMTGLGWTSSTGSMRGTGRAGGGMLGGQQGKMLEGGNAYLEASFPKLDHLVRTRIAGCYSALRGGQSLRLETRAARSPVSSSGP